MSKHGIREARLNDLLFSFCWRDFYWWPVSISLTCLNGSWRITFLVFLWYSILNFFTHFMPKYQTLFVFKFLKRVVLFSQTNFVFKFNVVFLLCYIFLRGRNKSFNSLYTHENFIDLNFSLLLHSLDISISLWLISTSNCFLEKPKWLVQL